MFSIIVLFNEIKKESSIKKFFAKLSNLIQGQKQIEIIFVVEEDCDIIDQIEKFQDKNNNSITKFIFLYKKDTLNKIFERVEKLITNDYFFVITNTSEIAPSFFETITKVIESSEPDIIEFCPSLAKPLKWNPKDRLDPSKFDKPLKITDNEDIIAFTYPFIFNKVYSKSLLSKTMKSYMSNNDFSDNSNILFTCLIYLFFLKADKYWYISKKMMTFEIDEMQILNYNSIISQWDLIKEKFSMENKYLSEFNYAKLYYLKIFLCSLYFFNESSRLMQIININNKNNFNHKKYQEKLDEIMFSEFKDFYLKNKYIILNNSIEANLLKHNHPISKWPKLLKELEK